MKSSQEIIRIFKKELWTERKSKFTVSSVLLFVLGSSFLIALSLTGAVVTPQVFASMLWILIYFGNISGLGRSFVLEKERSTDLFLKLNFKGASVYFGKLIYNIAVSLGISILSYFLLLVFIPPTIITSPILMLFIVLSGAVALASGITIVSAIVAVANAKSSLLPILSLPTILPVLLLGVAATEKTIIASDVQTFYSDILFMLSFSGAIISVSYVLFGFVWDD